MFREGYSPREHYSGRQHERDLFGGINTNSNAYQEEFQRIANERGYMPRNAALELVKHHQPWQDASNPDKDFLRELTIAVRDHLNLDAEQSNDVRAYTAVGTPLDVFHGTDAFLTIREGGREFVITLDATRNAKKLEEGGKADVIVGDMPTPEDEEDAYLAAIDSIAEEVVRNVKRQSEPPNAMRF